jgi:hypothetical protein
MKALLRMGITIAAALVSLSTTFGQAPVNTPVNGVTFAKDVAPILQKRCQECHRANTFAPMSLLTYEDVRPWARAIKQKVLAREMPPWYIDKNVGIQQFRNDVSLSDQEIATIAAWVDAGAPKGHPSDMPPPRQFQDLTKWHIGEPDLIVELPKDLVVPAKAPDKWLDIIVDPGLTEDRYIKAIETRPLKGFKVVHHVVTTLRSDDDTGADGVPSPGVFLNEYALGKNGDVFEQDSGRLIKAGSKINFNMHLHAVGEETAANVALGMKLYPKGYVPKFIEITEAVGSTRDLDIPPNTDNVRADGYTTLTKPARILSFQPHLHNRGKAQCMEAIYPGGRKVETLSCVNRYQFAWHLVYLYAEDEQPLLPAGTILHTISWYNNTASNRFNPDPDALVTYGQRTIDEMSHTWVNFQYLTDEEFKQQVEARAAKHKNMRASSTQ